jgi:putative ABC transport system permease protein
MTFSGASWKLASRNLLRNRRRTVATGLAVACGFVALVLLGAYIVRAAYALTATTVYLNLKGHVAIHKQGSLDGFSNKPSKFILTSDDRARILAALDPWSKQIEFTGEFLSGTGLLTDGKRSAPVLITGVDPLLYPKLVGHPQIKKWASDWAPPEQGLAMMATNSRLVSITEKLAEYLGRKPPFTALPEKERDAQILAKNYFHDLGAVDVELGPSHSTGMAFLDSTSLIAPLKLLQDLFSTDGSQYVAVFLHDRDDADSLSRALSAKLGAEFEVFAFNDDRWSQFYVGQMNFLYVMGGFFTFLILGTVSLAIVNTTTLNLLERTKEIGTMRAMGYPPAGIRAIFTREAILLCIGCLIGGTGVAWLIALLVNSINIRFSPPGAQGSVQFLLMMSWPVSLAMAALMFTVTVISTYLVTRRKSRTKIVQLLGETGA